MVFEDYNITSTESYPTFEDFLKIIGPKKQNDVTINDEVLNIKKNMKTIRNRSKEWLEAASTKLTPLFKKLIPLSVSSVTTIRKEMCNMCQQLLLNCFENLNINTPYLLESLIVLSEDEDNDIKLRVLEICRKLSFVSRIDHYEMLLKPKLFNMRSIIQRKNSIEQEYNFRFLKGYFKILNDLRYLQSLLLLPGVLDDFLYAIISALELEPTADLLISYKDDNIRIENSGNRKMLRPYYWQSFKNISNLKTVYILFDILKICGSSDAAKLIFERLMEIKANSDFKTEIFFIAILLISGDTSTAFHGNLLNNLISPENMKLSMEIELNISQVMFKKIHIFFIK